MAGISLIEQERHFLLIECSETPWGAEGGPKGSADRAIKVVREQ